MICSRRLTSLLLAAAFITIPATATAVTRDVEVTDVAASDGQLRVLPAIALLTDVRGTSTFDLALVNGGEAAVDVELGFVTSQPDADGKPTPTTTPVTWATLPRSRVRLEAGHRADLSAVLTPPAGALPTVVHLVASTVGVAPVQAVATAVLVPVGAEPEVSLDLSPTDLTLAATAATVVDVAIVSTAFPGRSSRTSAGPLVLLPATPRTVEHASPGSPFGVETVAVAAIDGDEVARTSIRDTNLAAIALAVVAGALVLSAVYGLSRRLRPQKTRIGSSSGH